MYFTIQIQYILYATKVGICSTYAATEFVIGIHALRNSEYCVMFIDFWVWGTLAKLLVLIFSNTMAYSRQPTRLSYFELYLQPFRHAILLITSLLHVQFPLWHVPSRAIEDKSTDNKVWGIDKELLDSSKEPTSCAWKQPGFANPKVVLNDVDVAYNNLCFDTTFPIFFSVCPRYLSLGVRRWMLGRME